MDKPNITFHKAETKDTEKIVAFHQNPALQEWEEEFHGYIHEDGVLFLAKDGDKVIGSQGFLPYKMNIDGESVLVSRSERTLLSPDYRGMGLFGKIYDKCIEYATERGSKFVFGSTAATKAFERVGFRSELSFSLHLVQCVSLIALFQCIKSDRLDVPVSLSEFINTLKTRDKWRGLEFVKIIAAIPSRFFGLVGDFLSLFSDQKYEVLERVKGNKDLSDLYSFLREMSGSLIYLEQDESFVEWHERVCGTSKRFYAYSGNELQGYVVCNFDNPGTVKILDIASKNDSALRVLMKKVMKVGRSEGRAFLKLSFNYRCAPIGALLPSLLWLGFLPVYRGGNEVLRPLADDLPQSYSNIESFYITEIWHSLGRETREEQG